VNKDISVSKKFKLDPLLPQFTDLNMYYKNSGYDCGHQMDAFDCGYNLTAMAESFYYSNITPQLPALKRAIGKALKNTTES
jgi:endonuclease G, mitochondrial